MILLLILIENESKIMEEHFFYLKSLLKKKNLFLAGPTLIPEEPFGVIILEANTADEARDLLGNDPSIKAKIQKVVDF